MSGEEIELETAQPYNNAHLVDYRDNSIIIRTIMSKPTGFISIAAFSEGESMEGKLSPFNTLLEVVEGEAEILIAGEAYSVVTGESIIVPSNMRSTLTARKRFKILTTVIKTGY